MTQKQPYGETTISLKGIFRFMILHWKAVLFLVLVGALFLGGYGVYSQHKKIIAEKNMPVTKDKTIKIDEAGFNDVKAYVEYEEIVAKKQEYMEQSIMMRIDPLHKVTGVVRYSFLFEDEVAHDSVQLANICADELRKTESMEYLQQVAGIEEDISYLNEITIIDVASVPGTFSVTFIHDNMAQIEKLLDTVEQFYNERPDLGAAVVGNYTVNVTRYQPSEGIDTTLLDNQANRKAELTNLQTTLATRYNLLTQDEIKYLELYRDAKDQDGYVEGQPLVKTEQIKKTDDHYMKVFIKNAAKGGIIMFVGCFVAVMLALLVSPVLLSGDCLTEHYVLATIECRKKGQSEEMAAFLAAVLSGRKHEGKIALLSSRRTLTSSDLMKKVQEDLAKAGLSVVLAHDIDQDDQELNKLQGVSEVYLLETVYKSKYKRISSELLICNELNIPVRSAFLIQI